MPRGESARNAYNTQGRDTRQSGENVVGQSPNVSAAQQRFLASQGDMGRTH